MQAVAEIATNPAAAEKHLKRSSKLATFYSSLKDVLCKENKTPQWQQGPRPENSAPTGKPLADL